MEPSRRAVALFVLQRIGNVLSDLHAFTVIGYPFKTKKELSNDNSNLNITCL